MSNTSDHHPSGQPPEPVYDNKRGCLTIVILAVVTIAVFLGAVLLFNDFGK